MEDETERERCTEDGTKKKQASSSKAVAHRTSLSISLSGPLRACRFAVVTAGARLVMRRIAQTARSKRLKPNLKSALCDVLRSRRVGARQV